MATIFNILNNNNTNMILVEINIRTLSGKIKYMSYSGGGYIYMEYIPDITNTNGRVKNSILMNHLPITFYIMANGTSQLVLHHKDNLVKILLGKNKLRINELSELRIELFDIMYKEREADEWEPHQKYTNINFVIVNYRDFTGKFGIFSPLSLKELSVMNYCIKTPHGMTPAFY